MKRTFEFNDEKSSKFWSIEVNGNEFTVNYGKTGTAGQTQTKTFADDAACTKEADKLIAEKTKKGYEEAQEESELEKHFASWAITPACKAILKDLLSHVTDVRKSDDGSMELDFLSTEDDEYTVEFGAPAPDKVPEDMPDSFRNAAKLHGYVSFDNGDANGLYWGASGEGSFEYYDDLELEGGEEFESAQDRYTEIATAAQNWFMIDRAKTNKLGEPLMMFIGHDGYNCVFAGANQKKTAFGIPGLLLRVLGYYILADDPRFEDCGMG